MNKLIERIIQRLHDEIDLNPVYDYEKGHNGAMHDAINIIEEETKAYNNGWIPVSECYPENETEVEITFLRKHYMTKEMLYLTARAFYTDGTLTTEDSLHYWNETDNWEYNEGKDSYMIPEGWWESVSFAEEFFAVDEKVIAWRPLSAPFREDMQQAKQTNGDRIRAMSNEELAMNMMCPNENGLGEIDCNKSDNCNCYECLMNWLKREAK